VFWFVVAVAAVVYFSLGVTTSIWVYLKYLTVPTPYAPNPLGTCKLLAHCTLMWPRYVLELKD
jgi:hypothetical protein